MSRPSDAAIAQAFWETCALPPEYHPGEIYTRHVVRRAHEIDATRYREPLHKGGVNPPTRQVRPVPPPPPPKEAPDQVEAHGSQVVICYGKGPDGRDCVAVYTAQAICDMGHELSTRSCQNSLPIQRKSYAPKESEISEAQRWVSANCPSPSIVYTVGIALDLVKSEEDLVATGRI